MAGIVSCGAFIPRLRLGRGRIAEAMGWLNPGLAGLEGERSACNWDEDSLTMAVEAGRAALANAGSPGIERLGFASTTFPFADRSNATVVATASPLPARITWWSVTVALGLGAGVGVLFGVYPARRAARLDPITAMRAE